MTGFGSGWYGDVGGSHPAAMTPGMVPGGYNPMYSNLFDYSMSNAQSLATGGFGAGGIMQLLQAAGQMIGYNILPTGGNFSPMGRAMYDQQQEAMLRGMRAVRPLDESQYYDMAMNIQSRMMPGADPAAVERAASAWAGTAMSVMGDNRLQMAIQSGMLGPMTNRMLESTFGSTNSAMFMNLYGGTRAYGTDTADVAWMTKVLGGAYMPAGTGQVNQQFAQGLNQREIGEAAAFGFQSFALDPSLARTDPEKFKRDVQGLNAITSSLKDIFGPDAPVPKILADLQQMTQGGLGQMGFDDMRLLVDKMKIVSLNTGISMQAITAMSTQSAMAARQAGLPGVVGTDIALDTATIAKAMLTTRDANPVWGRVDPGQVVNEVMQAEHALASSPSGVNAMGVLRLAEVIGGSGVDMTKGAGKDLAELAGRIRSGKLIRNTGDPSKDDFVRLANTGGMASDWGGLLVGGQAAVANVLTDKTANSEFRSQAHAGTLQMLMNDTRDMLLGSLVSDPMIREIADGKKMSVNDVAEAAMNAIQGAEIQADGRISNAARENAIKEFGAKFGLDPTKSAQLSKLLMPAMSQMEQAMTGARGMGLDLLGGARNINEALAKTAEQAVREGIIKDEGVGVAGSLANRIYRLATGDSEVTTNDVIYTMTGSATEKDLRKIAAIMGGPELMAAEQIAQKASELEQNRAKFADPNYKGDKRELAKVIAGQVKEIDEAYKPGSSRLDVLGSMPQQRRLDSLLSGLRYLGESGQVDSKAIKSQVDALEQALDSDEGKDYIARNRDEIERRYGSSAEDALKKGGVFRKELERIRDMADKGDPQALAKLRELTGEGGLGRKLLSATWRQDSKGEWEYDSSGKGFSIDAKAPGGEVNKTIVTPVIRAGQIIVESAANLAAGNLLTGAARSVGAFLGTVQGNGGTHS